MQPNAAARRHPRDRRDLLLPRHLTKESSHVVRAPSRARSAQRRAARQRGHRRRVTPCAPSRVPSQCQRRGAAAPRTQPAVAPPRPRPAPAPAPVARPAPGRRRRRPARSRPARRSCRPATRATRSATSRPGWRQIAWYFGDVDGTYGDLTVEAVGASRRSVASRSPAGRPAHPRPAARHDHRAEPRPAGAAQHPRSGRPALPDGPGAVRRQDQPHAALGVDGEVQRTFDVRFGSGGHADPRGRVQRRLHEPRPRLRRCTTPRCRSRCSSPAARRCTTRRTSRRSATPAPRTAASTCATTRASPGCSIRSQIGDKVIVYWS